MNLTDVNRLIYKLKKCKNMKDVDNIINYFEDLYTGSYTTIIIMTTENHGYSAVVTITI